MATPTRRRGRPAQSASGGIRPTLNVRIAPDLMKAIPAAGEGRTAFVEDALRAKLATA